MVNRKILVVVLALAIILLATPIVGTVMAGKGREKLDFTLYFEAPMLTDFETIGLNSIWFSSNFSMVESLLKLV